MGIDPETEKKVEFDITNPQFLEKYFEILHHLLEEEGVDFWWMDWQQGNTSSVPELAPLCLLTHSRNKHLYHMNILYAYGINRCLLKFAHMKK